MCVQKCTRLITIWLSGMAKFRLSFSSFFIASIFRSTILLNEARIESSRWLEEITGYSRKTIQDFKSVATRIESPCRHEDVSFEHQYSPTGEDVPYNHFKEIAPLPPDEQKCFLNTQNYGCFKLLRFQQGCEKFRRGNPKKAHNL